MMTKRERERRALHGRTARKYLRTEKALRLRLATARRRVASLERTLADLVDAAKGEHDRYLRDMGHAQHVTHARAERIAVRVEHDDESTLPPYLRSS